MSASVPPSASAIRGSARAAPDASVALTKDRLDQFLIAFSA
jgi:hypothetical protein